MNEGRTAKSRRWQHTTAIAGALSLFVALIAGSSLRPHYNTAVLPEPLAWTHATHPSRTGGSRILSGPEIVSSSHSAPASRKPFRNVWMTRDMPRDWTSLSPQRDWSELPASFLAGEYQLSATERASPATTSSNRHSRMLFCVNRC